MEAGTQLWLARHGETTWNRTGRLQGHSDVALSAEGERQAHSLAERLADLGLEFAALYTSDLQRANRTAQIVGDRIGLDPLPLPELREVHVGEFAGLTPPEIRQQIAERFGSRSEVGHRWPGGESTEELEERVWGAMTDIAHDHPGKRVLVVSHGGSIRAALKRAMGLPRDYRLRVVLDNTSLTVLLRRQEHWYLGCLNEVRHLGEITFT